MADVVLDSSAILATLFGEPGGDLAKAAMKGACISAVICAEVLTKLIDQGLTAIQAQDAIDRLGCELMEVDKYRGALAGALHERTRRRGISLGDRFCLALAEELGLPVLTSDRRWTTLDLGVEVTLIR